MLADEPVLANEAELNGVQPLMCFTGHMDWILAVCVVEDIDGVDLLVSASQDKNVTVYNTVTGHKVGYPPD